MEINRYVLVHPDSPNFNPRKGWGVREENVKSLLSVGVKFTGDSVTRYFLPGELVDAENVFSWIDKEVMCIADGGIYIVESLDFPCVHTENGTYHITEVLPIAYCTSCDTQLIGIARKCRKCGDYLRMSERITELEAKNTELMHENMRLMENDMRTIEKSMRVLKKMKARSDVYRQCLRRIIDSPLPRQGLKQIAEEALRYSSGSSDIQEKIHKLMKSEIQLKAQDGKILLDKNNPRHVEIYRGDDMYGK